MMQPIIATKGIGVIRPTPIATAPQVIQPRPPTGAVALVTGEYVSEGDFARLTQAEQAYLRQHGIEAFNREQARVGSEAITAAAEAEAFVKREVEADKEWRAKHTVEVGPGKELVLKAVIDKLEPQDQTLLRELGTQAFNQHQEQVIADFEAKHVAIKDQWVTRDDFDKLTPIEQSLVLEGGLAAISTEGLKPEAAFEKMQELGRIPPRAIFSKFDAETGVFSYRDIRPGHEVFSGMVASGDIPKGATYEGYDSRTGIVKYRDPTTDKIENKQPSWYAPLSAMALGLMIFPEPATTAIGGILKAGLLAAVAVGAINTIYNQPQVRDAIKGAIGTMKAPDLTAAQAAINRAVTGVVDRAKISATAIQSTAASVVGAMPSAADIRQAISAAVSEFVLEQPRTMDPPGIPLTRQGIDVPGIPLESPRMMQIPGIPLEQTAPTALVGIPLEALGQWQIPGIPLETPSTSMQVMKATAVAGSAASVISAAQALIGDRALSPTLIRQLGQAVREAEEALDDVGHIPTDRPLTWEQIKALQYAEAWRSYVASVFPEPITGPGAKEGMAMTAAALLAAAFKMSMPSKAVTSASDMLQTLGKASVQAAKSVEAMITSMTQAATVAANEAATQARAKDQTDAEISMATQTAAQAAAQAAAQTHLASITNTAVQSMTAAHVASAVKSAVKAATATATARIRRIPKLRKKEKTREDDRELYPAGTVVWNQGKLGRGYEYKIIPPPYDLTKPISSTKPPKGMKRTVGTPQQTLTFLKGKVPFKDVAFDLGVVDGFIDVKRKTITFTGGGLKTNVGKRMPQPTKGITLHNFARPKTRRKLVPRRGPRTRRPINQVAVGFRI